MPDPTSLSFDFKKSVLGAAGAGGLVIAPTAALLDILKGDHPFPGGEITLVSGSLQAQADKSIVFGGDGQGDVTFGGSADASLKVNVDPAQVAAGLKLAEPIADGLSFSAGGPSAWAALQCSYDLKGSAKGAMGLGGGVKATFGADGQKTGAFALLHRFAPTDPARQVLADLVVSWQLPRQIGGPDDLRPGTWLIAEVDGSLSLSLGVQYGYLFNWLRQVEGKLAGDIALRLQLGLSATIGFTASGRYALAVSRPSSDAASKVLRLQLFKQSKKGWSFALDAGAQASVEQTVLPPTLEGLLRAVLNVHDGQILADLLQWLDSGKDLGDMLSNVNLDDIKKVLGEVTGVDVEQKLDEARAQLSGFLQKWGTLDQGVASSLWARIGDGSAVTAIRGLAEKISGTLGDETALRAILAQQIQKVNFSTTPEGQWLAAQATDGLLRLIESSQQLQRLRKVSDATLAILSQQGVLTLAQRLKQAIAERFDLDKVKTGLQKAIDATDPAKLDPWLLGRLHTFLDAAPTVQHLKDIKNAIDALQNKGQVLYAKTVKALQQQYQADLSVTYQQTTEGTALLDVDFDFAQDGDGSLGSLLQSALHGDFSRLFLDSRPGVTLHQATLTHQIKRERHIDVTLPSSFLEMGSINQAMGNVTASDDGGRVLLYEGSGTDDAQYATAKTRRDSRLSLVAQLPVRLEGLRQHESGSLTYSYSFAQATQNLPKDQLEVQVGAYAEKYLASSFPVDGDGTSSGAFSHWVDDLESEVEILDTQKNGSGNLGNTLVSLELGVSPAVGAAWLAAPASGDSRYLEMSRLIQAKLKELIPFYYFRNLKNYGEQLAGATLLAYAAIPPSCQMRLNNDGVPVADGNDLYWDFVNSGLRAGMINWGLTDLSLQREVARIHSVLAKVPGLGGIAQIYANPQVAAIGIRSRALSPGQVPLLTSLLFVESQIVKGAAQAGAEIAEFKSQAATNPEKAIAALASFASNLTSAFNEKVWSVYGKDAVRPLGTLLFTAAAAAFVPNLDDHISALLRIAILKQSAKFPPDQFPDDSALPADQILVEQAVVSG